jgi:hypothetical protein
MNYHGSHRSESLTDGAFLREVETGSIEGFGHRDHLRLAFLAARHGRTLDDVVERCRRGICAVATAQGVPGKYHATITVAWASIMRAVASSLPAATFDELIAQHPELLETGYLGRYYSRELLLGEEARMRFVEPDRASLPSPEPVRASTLARP